MPSHTFPPEVRLALKAPGSVHTAPPGAGLPPGAALSVGAAPPLVTLLPPVLGAAPVLCAEPAKEDVSQVKLNVPFLRNPNSGFSESVSLTTMIFSTVLMISQAPSIIAKPTREAVMPPLAIVIIPSLPVETMQKIAMATMTDLAAYDIAYNPQSIILQPPVMIWQMVQGALTSAVASAPVRPHGMRLAAVAGDGRAVSTREKRKSPRKKKCAEREIIRIIVVLFFQRHPPLIHPYHTTKTL